MGVNVRRRGEVAVAEPFLNLLHGYSAGEHQRSAGVPEIVEPDPPHTVLLQERGEC